MSPIALPLTYNRDLQEDKEAVFDSLDTVLVCLWTLGDTLGRSSFRPETAERLLRSGHLLATELADFLVGKRVAFRHAHETVGKVVRWCDEQGIDLADATEADLVALDKRLAGCSAALDFEKAVNRRDHVGGTATRRVRAAVKRWRKRLS